MIKLISALTLAALASPPHPHPPGPGPGPGPDGEPAVVSCMSMAMMGGTVVVSRTSGGRFRLIVTRFNGHAAIDTIAKGTIKPPEGGRLEFNGGYFRCKQVPAATTVIGQIKFDDAEPYDMSCSYEGGPFPFE